MTKHYEEEKGKDLEYKCKEFNDDIDKDVDCGIPTPRLGNTYSE